MLQVRYIEGHEEGSTCFRGRQRCGQLCKYGEPWLQNDWLERERCEEKKVHRQVGATSVTYNNNTNILLIPLTTSWSLANSDVVKVFLDEPNYESMMEVYEFQKSRGRTESLENHLATSPFHDEENETYDIERFFKSLAEFKAIQNQGPLAVDNVRKRD